MIITVTPLDYEKQCTFEFGSYDQIVCETYPKNGKSKITMGAMIFHNTMPLQGGYRVTRLKTGKTLTIRNNMVHELK